MFSRPRLPHSSTCSLRASWCTAARGSSQEVCSSRGRKPGPAKGSVETLPAASQMPPTPKTAPQGSHWGETRERKGHLGFCSVSLQAMCCSSHLGPLLVTSRCAGKGRSCNQCKNITGVLEREWFWALTLQAACQGVSSSAA